MPFKHSNNSSLKSKSLIASIIIIVKITYVTFLYLVKNFAFSIVVRYITGQENMASGYARTAKYLFRMGWII